MLEPVTLSAPVTRNEEPRGTVRIVFGKDCRITADWTTQYEHEKKKYQLQSQMKGNVVPSKVFSDPNNIEDKTRLFFIAKGPYTQTMRSADNLSQTEQGTAYILGWLSPNNTAEGTITITTDQNWSAVYTYQTAAQAAAAAN